jgi:hypothetical protein
MHAVVVGGVGASYGARAAALSDAPYLKVVPHTTSCAFGLCLCTALRAAWLCMCAAPQPRGAGRRRRRKQVAARGNGWRPPWPWPWPGPGPWPWPLGGAGIMAAAASPPPPSPSAPRCVTEQQSTEPPRPRRHSGPQRRAQAAARGAGGPARGLGASVHRRAAVGTHCRPCCLAVVGCGCGCGCGLRVWGPEGEPADRGRRRAPLARAQQQHHHKHMRVGTDAHGHRPRASVPLRLFHLDIDSHGSCRQRRMAWGCDVGVLRAPIFGAAGGPCPARRCPNGRSSRRSAPHNSTR